MANRRFTFEEKWNRASLDTQGFGNLRRQTFSSLAVATLVFLVQAWLYGDLEDAARDFWIALLAFVAAFVLLPAIEFVANFVRAPRRILEEKITKLIAESEKQTTLISELKARLSPKLGVKSLHITPTPTQAAGPCVYIQVLVECLADSPVENCQGHLLQVRRWGGAKWEITEFDERLQLGWSLEDLPAIILHPRVGRRLNVFWILQGSDRFILCTHSGTVPLRAQNVFNTTDVFRFDIVLTADSSVSVTVCLEAWWGEKWDEPRIAIVSHAEGPPILETASTAEST